MTVVDGGFESPHSAPAAGPEPYEPFQITPTVVYGFGTADAIGPRVITCRRFSQ